MATFHQIRRYFSVSLRRWWKNSLRNWKDYHIPKHKPSAKRNNVAKFAIFRHILKGFDEKNYRIFQSEWIFWNFSIETEIRDSTNQSSQRILLLTEHRLVFPDISRLIIFFNLNCRGFPNVIQSIKKSIIMFNKLGAVPEKLLGTGPQPLLIGPWLCSI